MIGHPKGEKEINRMVNKIMEGTSQALKKNCKNNSKILWKIPQEMEPEKQPKMLTIAILSVMLMLSKTGNHPTIIHLKMKKGIVKSMKG